MEEFCIAFSDASKPRVFKFILITNAFMIDTIRAVLDLIYLMCIFYTVGILPTCSIRDILLVLKNSDIDLREILRRNLFQWAHCIVNSLRKSFCRPQ